MKSVSVIRWLLVPLFLLAAFPVFAGPPQAVDSCPYYIDEPGKYRLTKDLLDCIGGVGIIASDVTLDLKGHTISCAESTARSGGVWTGIDRNDEFVPVHNVKITNGTVTGCSDGILLAVAEDSKVTKMTSWGNRLWDDPDTPEIEAMSGTGITVWMSHHNVLMHNHVYNNAAHGIGSWDSSDNLFKHNTAVDNGGGFGGSGFDLTGESNSQILCNRVHGNIDGIVLYPSMGLGITSSGNLLRGNLVTDNMYSGIGMMGFAWDGLYWLDIPTANTVRSNVVEANGWFNFYEIYYDLATGAVLSHPDDTCMNNWVKNQYELPVSGPVACFGEPVTLDDDDVCALDTKD